MQSAEMFNLKNLEGRYKNKIRKYWMKRDIVFTDSWHGKELVERQVSENDLLPGELSAVTFTVGCYTVRSAQRVYKVHESGYSPELEIPADNEELDLIKQSKDVIFPNWNRKFRITHEIMAKHNFSLKSKSSNEYKYLCRAARARNYSWTENISLIITVKERTLSDEHASLFVKMSWTGESFGCEHWYELRPDGEVTNFRLHDLDRGDDDNTLWEDGSGVFWYFASRGSCVPFRINGKCGYAYYDTDVIMIEPQWDTALPFNAFGFAIVINGIPIDEFMAALKKDLNDYIPDEIIENYNFKAGLIDGNGNIVLPVIYDAIGNVTNHFLFVKQNGKWGALELKWVEGSSNIVVSGKIILPIEYDEVTEFGYTIFMRKNDKWGVCNSKGTILVDAILTECPYPSI